MNKRVKEAVSNIDRLSALPDSVLVHILSNLSVDESLITAVLSKRWQNLWTQSPELYFQQGSLLVPDFVSWVNRTLVIRTPVRLEFFVVDFEYTKPFASEVNAWAQFAANNKVKKVGFLLDTVASDFHVLPQLFCSSSSLVSLAIKGCTISPQRTIIDWPCLTGLNIEGVKLQQQSIENILSGCPVLSMLTLNQCWGFTSLKFKSKALVDIILVDCDRYGIHGPLLEIDAPFLRSVWVGLSCRPERRKLRLVNVPSSATVAIDFLRCDVESEVVMNNAKEFLELGANFVEVLSSMAIRCGYKFPESTTRTSWKVITGGDKLSDNIHGILALLQSSPNLEALVIQGKDYGMEPYYSTSAYGDLGRDLLHLKTVIIEDFVAPNLAGEPMLALVRILLRRPPVLEKMVICVEEITESTPALEILEILEKVKNYPRSSPKALILLG